MSKDAILIVGDLMVDEYLNGECHRVSPEAPVPVLNNIQNKMIIGGAGNVSLSVSNSEVSSCVAFKTLYGLNYNSQELSFVKNEMISHKIDYNQLTMSPFPSLDVNKNESPIPVKKRVVANGHNICRLDYENIDVPDKTTELNWFNKVVNIIAAEQVKVVLLSDYNKGTLSDSLINNIAEYCKTINIPIILDPKRPTWPHLKNLSLIKPNQREVDSTYLDISSCSKLLGETYLLHTQGKDGMSLWKNGEMVFHIPSFATSIVDVCSCGDAVMAMLGISFYNKLNIKESVVAANYAASFCIAQHGTYPISHEEISSCLNQAKFYDYGDKNGKKNGI